MAKPMRQDEFIKRASAVHNSKYSYDKTVYVNMRQKVIITCPLHGDFEQLPQPHLKGQGCPQCGALKQKDTMLERYGEENPMKVSEFFNKARETCKERYGYEWALSNPEIREKQTATVQERYGVDYINQSSQVRTKSKDTCRRLYGVDYIGQVPEFMEKARITSKERYGSEEPLGSPVIREKIAKTNQARYGGNAPLCSEDVKEKVKNTCVRRYGVTHPSKNQSVLDCIRETKRKHNTFHTSQSEDIMYHALCDIYGVSDVKRHYSSEEYPYACDFYIMSRDLYIELNALWTHGGEWFEGTEEHAVKLDLWNERDTDYYKNAVNTWSILDVKKRNKARFSDLNYLTFWDTKLRDFEVWLSSGMPSGKDWKHVYSWLPERSLRDIEPPVALTGTPRNLSLYAKYYQSDIFYRQEKKLWDENHIYKGLSLQMWLYANRMKYLGKYPEELTDAEILRGFTISGIHKGYSSFDTELMHNVVTEYNIKSIYDPCAGWGERFLYSYCHNIDYMGVDINCDLKPGYDKMTADFDIKNQKVIYQDSSEYFTDEKFDAVITCPPYGSLEHYSDNGAENYDETGFIAWWDKLVSVISTMNIKHFCFQINQKYKDSMVQVLEEHGFIFKDSFVYKSQKSSHFTRKAGTDLKKEFETMLVFTH